MFPSSPLHTALCVASLLALGACGNSAGGGGPTFVGAPAGSPCNTQYQNEGCLAGAAPVKMVKCVDNAGTQAWADKGVCGANQYCTEQPDPADPAGGKKLAICKDLPPTTGGVDATIGDGGTDGGGADAGGGTDASATVDAGPKKTIAEQYACIEAKCTTEVGACLANPVCGEALTCAKVCANEACRNECGAAALSDEKVFGLLLAMTNCGTKQKCLDAQSTGPVCGDGTCEATESAATCAKDCKTGPKCGNGQCEEGESSATCAADCEPVGAKCGNETCESGESYTSCPADCPCKTNTECGVGKICNDGVCQTQSSGAVCGNFTCDSGETKSSCALDCDPVVTSSIECVDKNCGSDWLKCKSSQSCVDALICMAKCSSETCVTTCAQQAPSDLSTLIAVGTCAQSKCPATGQPSCGNGTCDAGETTASCAADCKAPPQCTTAAQCKATEVCTAGKCVPGSSGGGTCKVQGCVYKKGASCNCDNQCAKFNDCCPDYATVCPKP